MKNQPKNQPGSLPPLNYALAARAEAQAQTGGAWSLRHLRICWAALGVVGLVITTVGWVGQGSRAGWGALLGTLIVGLFFSVSAVVIAKVGAKHPERVMWAALVSYVLKMVALGVVLVFIPTDGAVDTRWMAGAVALGLAAWLGAHMRFVWTNKIFYVSPQ